eukprot:gene15065-12325_t
MGEVAVSTTTDTSASPAAPGAAPVVNTVALPVLPAASGAVAATLPEVPSLPTPPLPTPPAMAAALYPYTAATPDQISMTQGESFTILIETGDWWSVQNASGQKGLAPSNFLILKRKRQLFLHLCRSRRRLPCQRCYIDNPFGEEPGAAEVKVIAPEKNHKAIFAAANPDASGLLLAKDAGAALMKSGLQPKDLRKVWTDAKAQGPKKCASGKMDLDEFIIAARLAEAAGGIFPPEQHAASADTSEA